MTIVSADVDWGRLQGKVLVGDGCWEWQGARGRGGYGRHSRRGGLHVYAHRYFYEIFVGPIPAGLIVCHACDNPPCVRPDHLFVGTYSDNAVDRETKGRGYESSQVVCQRGHEFTLENTYRHPKTGARNCLACRRAKTQEYNARVRAMKEGA